MRNLAITTLFLFAAGCSPCGGEIRLSRNPYRALIQPAPITIEGPGSAAVPFRVEPDRVEAPASGPLTTITNVQPIESRR